MKTKLSICIAVLLLSITTVRADYQDSTYTYVKDEISEKWEISRKLIRNISDIDKVISTSEYYLDSVGVPWQKVETTMDAEGYADEVITFKKDDGQWVMNLKKESDYHPRLNMLTANSLQKYENDAWVDSIIYIIKEESNSIRTYNKTIVGTDTMYSATSDVYDFTGATDAKPWYTSKETQTWDDFMLEYLFDPSNSDYRLRTYAYDEYGNDTLLTMYKPSTADDNEDQRIKDNIYPHFIQVKEFDSNNNLVFHKEMKWEKGKQYLKDPNNLRMYTYDSKGREVRFKRDVYVWSNSTKSIVSMWVKQQKTTRYSEESIAGGVKTTVLIEDTILTQENAIASLTNTKIITWSYGTAAGIGDINMQSEAIALYPTVNNGKFNITNSSNATSAAIYNIAGKMILQQSLNEGENHILLNCKPGVYILKTDVNNPIKFIIKK